MAERDETTTIGEILELAPGDRENKAWINGRFVAVVRHAQARKSQQGGFFYTAILHDPDSPDISIEASGSCNLVPYEGKVVEISGSSMSRDEYKGKPVIRMGSKVRVATMGAAAPAAAAPRQRTGFNTATSSGTGTGAPFIPPEAVGAAVNKAVDAILSAGLAVPGTPHFAKMLHEVASDIFRVSDHIKKGHLALPASKRPENEPEPQKELEPPEQVTEVEELPPELEAEPEPPAPPSKVAKPRTATPLPPEDDDVPFNGEAHANLVKNMLPVRRNAAPVVLLPASGNEGWATWQVQGLHQTRLPQAA